MSPHQPGQNAIAEGGRCYWHLELMVLLDPDHTISGSQPTVQIDAWQDTETIVFTVTLTLTLPWQNISQVH